MQTLTPAPRFIEVSEPIYEMLREVFCDAVALCGMPEYRDARVNPSCCEACAIVARVRRWQQHPRIIQEAIGTKNGQDTWLLPTPDASSCPAN